jgi:hypothetical protein
MAQNDAKRPANNTRGVDGINTPQLFPAATGSNLTERLWASATQAGCRVKTSAPPLFCFDSSAHVKVLD